MSFRVSSFRVRCSVRMTASTFMFLGSKIWSPRRTAPRTDEVFPNRPLLVQYPVTPHSFQCEQTFHILCPAFDFILDDRVPGPAMQSQKYKTLCLCSFILLHPTLYGTSLLLQIFVHLHQAWSTLLHLPPSPHCPSVRLVCLKVHPRILNCLSTCWLWLQVPPPSRHDQILHASAPGAFSSGEI